jgi:hypothetical protein
MDSGANKKIIGSGVGLMGTLKWHSSQKRRSSSKSIANPRTTTIVGTPTEHSARIKKGSPNFVGSTAPVANSKTRTLEECYENSDSKTGERKGKSELRSREGGYEALLIWSD